MAEKRPADKPSKDDPNGLPSTPLFEPPKYTKPTKAEALTRANGLADGFVLLGVSGEGLEDAWSWVIEGQDEPSLCESCYASGPPTDQISLQYRLAT